MQQLLVLRTNTRSLKDKSRIVLATHQHNLKNEITVEDAISIGYRLMCPPIDYLVSFEWWLERDIDNCV